MVQTKSAISAFERSPLIRSGGATEFVTLELGETDNVDDDCTKRELEDDDDVRDLTRVTSTGLGLSLATFNEHEIYSSLVPDFEESSHFFSQLLLVFSGTFVMAWSSSSLVDSVGFGGEATFFSKGVLHVLNSPHAC